MTIWGNVFGVGQRQARCAERGELKEKVAVELVYLLGNVDFRRVYNDKNPKEYMEYILWFLLTKLKVLVLKMFTPLYVPRKPDGKLRAQTDI